MAKARASTSPRKASPAKTSSAKGATRTSPRKATPSVKVKEAEDADKVRTGRVAKTPVVKKAAAKASPAKATKTTPKATKKASPAKAEKTTEVTTTKRSASPAKKTVVRTSPAKAKTTPKAAAAKKPASPATTTRVTRATAEKSPSPPKQTGPARKGPAKSPAKSSTKSPARSISKSPSKSPGLPRGRPPKKVSPAKSTQKSWGFTTDSNGKIHKLTANDLKAMDRGLKHALKRVSEGLAGGAIEAEALAAAWDTLRLFPRIAGYAAPEHDKQIRKMKSDYRKLVKIVMPDFITEGDDVKVYHDPRQTWRAQPGQGMQEHRQGVKKYRNMTERHRAGMEDFCSGIEQLQDEMHAAAFDGLNIDLANLHFDVGFSPSARSFFDSATSDASSQTLVGSTTAEKQGDSRARSPAKTRAASPAKALTKVVSGRVTKTAKTRSRSPAKKSPPPSPGTGLAYTRSKSPAKKMARSPSKSPAPVARNSRSQSPAKDSRSKSPAKTRAASRSKSPARQSRALPDTNTDIFDGNDTEPNRRPHNQRAQPRFGQADLPEGFTFLQNMHPGRLDIRDSEVQMHIPQHGPPSMAVRGPSPTGASGRSRSNSPAKATQVKKKSATLPLKASPGRSSQSKSRPDGRGTVISSTNPEFIDGTNKVNPFFETLPGPEIWHRRMPPYFPFGETPYMEGVMSRQIDEDLKRGLNEQKATSSQGPIGRAVSSVFSAALSPFRSKSAAPVYPPTWNLPKVTQKEIDEAIASYARSGGAAKQTKPRKKA